MKMYQYIVLFLIYFSPLQLTNGDFQKLREIYSWKSLDFFYPNSTIRAQAIENRSFIPGNAMPIDIDIAQITNGARKKVFITIPRINIGIPATLGYITEHLTGDYSPLIAPYPNLEMNTLDGDCDNIISVYRIKVDECNRLWVLDTGNLKNKQVCPAKLLVFDLSTNKLISRYQFPSDQVKRNSLFITPVVDIRYRQCANAFVYIADVEAYQLIVYDHKHKKSWNIHHKLFTANSNYSHFTIEHENFELMDGIFGLALGPLDKNTDRKLYFHSLASVTENYVYTSVIRSSRIFEGNPHAGKSYFQSYKYKRLSQSTAEVMNKNGILFYSLLSQTALACWNTIKYPQMNNDTTDIMIENPETLQFPSGLKLSLSSHGQEELWAISIRFQKIMANTINANSTNFRIQAGFVDELIHGTRCE